MYPTVGVPSGRPSQANSTGSRGGEAATGSKATSTTLSVHIDPALRVAPPVRGPAQPPSSSSSGPPGAPAPPPGRPPIDFELERKLLAGEASSTNGSNEGSLGQQQRRQDPLEATLQRCMAMGFSREEASMALTIARAAGQADDSQHVAEAARKFQSLREIGFPRELAVGALVQCEGDLERATDACLATTA